MGNSATASSSHRCLVTGLDGFTGKYVAAALTSAGHEVFGLGHDVDPVNGGRRSVDLLDAKAVHRAVHDIAPDVVIHLAAIAFVAHGDVDAIYRTNVVGTRNLLSALAESGYGQHSVLLASSANVYGNAATDAVAEDWPAAPLNDYAVSKLAMEYMSALWQDRLPICIARPFNYTGVGQSQKFVIPKIVDHFRRGERQIELGNLDVERDFSDVRTVAAAYCSLIDVCRPGQVVNICSGVGHSLAEVIGTLEAIAGYRISVEVNPAFVRPNELKRLVGDNTRLHEMVGQLPAFPLAHTLDWMYRA